MALKAFDKPCYDIFISVLSDKYGRLSGIGHWLKRSWRHCNHKWRGFVCRDHGKVSSCANITPFCKTENYFTTVMQSAHTVVLVHTWCYTKCSSIYSKFSCPTSTTGNVIVETDHLLSQPLYGKVFNHRCNIYLHLFFQYACRISLFYKNKSLQLKYILNHTYTFWTSVWVLSYLVWI